jgi:hypothetical protein
MAKNILYNSLVIDVLAHATKTSTRNPPKTK